MSRLQDRTGANAAQRYHKEGEEARGAVRCMLGRDPMTVDVSATTSLCVVTGQGGTVAVGEPQRQGISTGLASSVSSRRTATQTRTVRETKHRWLDTVGRDPMTVDVSVQPAVRYAMPPMQHSGGKQSCRRQVTSTQQRGAHLEHAVGIDTHLCCQIPLVPHDASQSRLHELVGVEVVDGHLLRLGVPQLR